MFKKVLTVSGIVGGIASGLWLFASATYAAVKEIKKYRNKKRSKLLQMTSVPKPIVETEDTIPEKNVIGFKA